MSALSQDFEPEPPAATAEPPPHVFVRTVVMPAGAPWEQTRAAHLDARHGAPLPIGELVHRIKRLSRWAPGRPGRFAVFYVRAQEARRAFETSVEVDGQLVKVAFGAGPHNVRRARLAGVVLLLFVATGAVVGAGVTLALKARAETAAQLAVVESASQAKLASAQAYRRQLDRSRDLRGALGRAAPMESVIEDLTWVAASKAPDARIAAVHWDHGVLGVEVRGDKPPFFAPDRPLQRSEQPLRPGVWLWGVGARQRWAGAPGPAAPGIGP